MIKFPDRKPISDLDRIRFFNRILVRTLFLLVTAFALWLQLEFGILEVLWNKIF